MERSERQKLFDRIHKVDFQEGQYWNESVEKNQIVWHHSHGWDNARGMFRMWQNDKQRVATCIGVEDDGKVLQAFHSSKYGYHLGVTQSLINNYGGNSTPKLLNMRSIGVEICSFGPIIYGDDGKYHPLGYPSISLPKEEIYEYTTPFRGYCFYERYTPDEIETARLLALYWNEKYGIPLDYHPDMWDVSSKALSGEPGNWTHVSFRPEPEKFDCHPQADFVQMLKELKSDAA